jgi:hypothetical protein
VEVKAEIGKGAWIEGAGTEGARLAEVEGDIRFI